MTRTALLATTAAWILAAPAIADGKGGKTLTGLGEFGYDHTNYDVGGAADDFDVNSFHGVGSALWTWPNMLNVQGNFAFNTDRLEADGGEEATFDTWRFGGGVFYRDPAQGSLGADLHYQSLDIFGQYVDGVDLTGRGELFFTKATLGAHVGYSTFDREGFELDGWQLGAYGKYYLQPEIGLKLGVDYGSWENNGDDLDDFSLNGEVEYLIPDCTTSIYAGLSYGSLDADGNDVDSWRFGFGARVHFGTDGPLIQRNRVEPLPFVGRTAFVF